MGKGETDVPAAVLGGLKVLQPLNLVFNGSFTVLLRFGISPAKIGLFIGDTGACKKFWTIVGDILGIAAGTSVLADSRCPPGIAAASTLLILLTNIRLFYVCLRCNGYDGVRKYFFWLCLSGGVNQFDSVVAIPSSGAAGSYYFLCMELYTIFLPSLFGIVTLFGKCFGFDIEYWKLVFQLLSMFLLTLASFVLWIAQAINEPGDPTGEQPNYTKPEHAVGAAVSPWFMGFIGFGILFCAFPAVWPFMVCHFSHYRFVMLFSPVLGSIAVLIPWALDLAKATTFFHRWDGNNGNNNSWAYHFTWLCVPGSLFLFKIIISCVHYPSGYFGRKILHSGWAVFWGSLFFFISSSARAFGLNGCAANVFNVGGGANPNGDGRTVFNSSCFGISIITMTASLFTTQAYSGGYSSFKCAVDSGCSWPTQGLGGFRSFFWWWGYGLRHGTKRFNGLRSIDIISVIS